MCCPLSTAAAKPKMQGKEEEAAVLLGKSEHLQHLKFLIAMHSRSCALFTTELGGKAFGADFSPFDVVTDKEGAMKWVRTLKKPKNIRQR